MSTDADKCVEWIRTAPEGVKEWMRSVHVMNFLIQRRSEAFQMQGRYDGSMSEECKQRFAREGEMLTAIIAELHKEPL